jgi:hypothetical protein
MATNSRKTAEKELYEPIKKYLEEAFTKKFGNCYLETTANGIFSDAIKKVVRHDIIFSFLGKKASPDLAGFIHAKGSNWVTVLEGPSIVKDFITVEIKRGKITLQDIYQTKMYGDLFQAKYALLISPEDIPEEIRRLDKHLFVTYRFMSGWHLHIGEWSSETNAIGEFTWLPYSPFQD